MAEPKRKGLIAHGVAAQNRKARFDYAIKDTVEAGLVLMTVLAGLGWLGAVLLFRRYGALLLRLEQLGVTGVRASTFHSAAYAQLRHLSQDEPAQILPSKAQALRQIANTLPKPYKFRPAGDLATEVEWAKNRRIHPDTYLDRLGRHDPPIPSDLMASVYKRYESGKRRRNLIDFEDLLELTIQMFQNDPFARERFAAKYLALTVDEYQDVNLLQETILREWVGERDDLCVVGDDYQSIYGFTGASPRYLLEMPGLFPNTRVIRL